MEGKNGNVERGEMTKMRVTFLMSSLNEVSYYGY